MLREMPCLLGGHADWRPAHPGGCAARKIAANRAQADCLAERLSAFGYRIGPLTDWEAERFEFSSEEIEGMLQMEHERWCSERRGQGWKQGAERDDDRNLHPDVVPWEELPEEARIHSTGSPGLSPDSQVLFRCLPVIGWLMDAVSAHRSKEAVVKVVLTDAAITGAALLGVWLLLNAAWGWKHPFLALAVASLLVALAAIVLWFSGTYMGAQFLLTPALLALGAFSSVISLVTREGGVLWPVAVLLLSVTLLSAFMVAWREMM